VQGDVHQQQRQGGAERQLQRRHLREALNGAEAYERFAYPGFAYPATHPARLEAIGRLFGLQPAAATDCRILELGCGDGGNVLSLAQALPQASLLGIDAAEGAIARGTELARAAGLGNAELRALSFEDLPEELGPFDYILSHGVYSWIPPRARTALLACVRRALSPTGIAYVSYNAYPGSYMRDMARDILGYHVREVEDPQRKLALAQELMQTIVAIEEPSPYAQVLRQHMERMLRYSDALLMHDDLAEVSTPFYFHEFMEHANHHRLAFLSEADLFESQMRDVPASAEHLMQSLPDDVLVREQYLDFFKNRMFRQTLLCHIDVPISRELDDRQVERLQVCSQIRPVEQSSEEQDGEDTPRRGEETAREVHASTGEDPGDGLPAETFRTPEGFTVTTSEPLVRAALHAVAEAWPAAVDFPTLLACAVEAAGPGTTSELVASRLRAVLLQAYLARIVVLQSCPAPLSTQPGERPLASALARAQCAAGAPALSSLLHANVRLEGELEPALLALLDGSHDRSALIEQLSASAGDVDTALERLASVGLLQR
jgi:methyltransferase-like protein/2-polyprenyl-3-methyl-5-hydroxy-6-metoxy-1,4-benzoquinol methylase